MVGVQGSSKLRARPKPLIEKGLNRARRTLFRGDGSSYLLLELPELLGLLGLELGLEDDFFEALLPVEPVLELPLVPDVLEPLGDDVEPPEADLLLSRSHPVTRTVPRDNASAATNAVNFMLTSMVVCANRREQGMDRELVFTKTVLYTDHDGRAKFREERVPLAEGTPQSRLSVLLPASGYQLRESPVGFRSEFHCTPKPQWVFILQGEMEIGLRDGSSRRFGPGAHFFAADVLPEGARFDARLHGHWSAQRGAEPLVTLFLKV